ncbi:hypothetical protein [Streptomyces asiaticus]|uniref:hypothetical protein n=1 Tax=Streptomyces asiaticus TaxID=114695 RepID=UPI00380FE944
MSAPVPREVVPEASKRQYATVPRGITAEAGRGLRGTAGAKPEKRRSKSMFRLNRSAGPVSSMVSASRGVRFSGSRLRNQGEKVSTSITSRTRSKA